MSPNNDSRLAQYSILVADDELKELIQLEKALNRHFHQIYTAKDGNEAWEFYGKYKPDLVILDIRMPEKDGVEVARLIRECSECKPIIFMTAYDEKKYMLESIKLHVDDFLIKPFRVSELMESLQSAIARLPKQVVLGEGCVYDFTSKHVLYDGSEIVLSKMQYELLEILIKKPNQVVTYGEIMHLLYPDRTDNLNALRTLVKKLRQNLPVELISVSSGLGYKITTQA